MFCWALAGAPNQEEGPPFSGCQNSVPVDVACLQRGWISPSMARWSVPGLGKPLAPDARPARPGSGGGRSLYVDIGNPARNVTAQLRPTQAPSEMGQGY